MNGEHYVEIGSRVPNRNLIRPFKYVSDLQSICQDKYFWRQKVIHDFVTYHQSYWDLEEAFPMDEDDAENYLFEAISRSPTC